MLSKRCMHCECHYIDCMLDHTKYEIVTRAKLKSWPYNFKGKKKRKIKLLSEQLLYLHTKVNQILCFRVYGWLACVWKHFPLFAILLLAAERTKFMLVLGYFLSFFSLIHLPQKLWRLQVVWRSALCRTALFWQRVWEAWKLWYVLESKIILPLLLWSACLLMKLYNWEWIILLWTLGVEKPFFSCNLWSYCWIMIYIIETKWRLVLCVLIYSVLVFNLHN